MNFRAGYKREEPEINLIPLIDVLLVLLIFLMVTTTYSRFSELQIDLPVGRGEVASYASDRIIVLVSKNGDIRVADQLLSLKQPEVLTAALKKAAQGRSDAMVIIDADALASHQSVVSVMEAASRAGLTQLTFATRTPTL